MVLLNVTDFLDISKLALSRPRPIKGKPNSLYIPLTYDGKSLFIQSSCFHGRGIYTSQYNQQLFVLPEETKLRDLVEKVHSFVAVTLPTLFPEKEEEYRAITALKPLTTPVMFAPVTEDMRAFSFQQKPMKWTDLGDGTYKVLLYMPGIFVGSHGDSAHRASLQMKVKQVMHQSDFLDGENGMECLLTPIETKSSK